jgi:hypothetical protein
MSPYFDNPQYLKINGRPVIFILIRYAGDRLTLQEESLLLTRIKDTKSFARKIGQNPYLVGVYSIGDGRFDRTSRKISQEFDTITIYNMPAAGGNSTSYDFMVSAYKSRTKDWSEEVKAANISFIPNVIPGFDDSLSYRHGTRGWLITRSGSTPKKFQMMCEAIKQYINPNNNMLMITAWNEFAEGSVIEPTKEYGFSYLEVIKQTFTTTPKELYKQALFTQSVVRSFVPIRGKNPFRIGGFTLQGLDAAGFNHPETFDSLDRLIKTGANSVTISPQVFMKTGDSSSIEGLNTRPSHQLADIGKVVEYLRNAGISVAIKPDLLPSDGTWSGRIHPTNAGIFFQNYKQIMLGYAALAKDKGVDTLYLSNEMKSMVVDPRYTGYWTDIIQSIRKVFPGKISLNSTIDDGNGLSGSEVMNIPFADRLDFIGVSLYIPLTNKGDPTVEDLVKAWYRNRDGVDIIESLKNINKRYGKPVMISEIAYRSIRGANTRPSDMNGKGVVDFQEQANLFEALMRVLTKERGDWLMGVSIWAWFTDLDPSAELPAKGYTILFGEQGSTIQNKPAEKLLTDWFLGVRQAAN